jgi:hypothetical protein
MREQAQLYFQKYKQHIYCFIIAFIFIILGTISLILYTEFDYSKNYKEILALTGAFGILIGLLITIYTIFFCVCHYLENNMNNYDIEEN